jgi:hypothetical protein
MLSLYPMLIDDNTFIMKEPGDIIMCNFVPKASDLTDLKNMMTKTSFFIREMFSRKEAAPAAFDFVSPPKEEKRQESGKACSAV